MIIACSCPNYGSDARACGHTGFCECDCHRAKPIDDEEQRLRTALEMIAQVRHVHGSAQANFRYTLRFVDAVLEGADVRKLEVVESIAKGLWVKS